MSARGGVVFRPTPEVVARAIAGQHLLVPVCTGLAQMDYLYTTDVVGSFVYAQLDGRRDAAAVAQSVASEFAVDEDAALGDVLAFLETLEEAGLVLREKDTP